MYIIKVSGRSRDDDYYDVVVNNGTLPAKENPKPHEVVFNDVVRYRGKTIIKSTGEKYQVCPGDDITNQVFLYIKQIEIDNERIAGMLKYNEERIRMLEKQIDTYKSMTLWNRIKFVFSKRKLQ
jgi:hypothetical protein